MRIWFTFVIPQQASREKDSAEKKQEKKMNSTSFVKMLLHAAKYPHCSVNGIFLRRQSKEQDPDITIKDCIPMFHLNLTLLPMLEIALSQVCISFLCLLVCTLFVSWVLCHVTHWVMIFQCCLFCFVCNFVYVYSWLYVEK